MNQNDLNILLAEFREKQPGDLRVRKWQKAVKAELAKGPAPRYGKTWMQMAAAMLVGFLVGGLYFRSAPPAESLAQNNFSSNATYEYVYTKSE